MAKTGRLKFQETLAVVLALIAVSLFFVNLHTAPVLAQYDDPNVPICSKPNACEGENCHGQNIGNISTALDIACSYGGYGAYKAYRGYLGYRGYQEYYGYPGYSAYAGYLGAKHRGNHHIYYGAYSASKRSYSAYAGAYSGYRGYLSYGGYQGYPGYSGYAPSRHRKNQQIYYGAYGFGYAGKPH